MITIKGVKMDEEYSSYGAEEACVEGFVGKFAGKRHVER
jgi:hypothetical protein